MSLTDLQRRILLFEATWRQAPGQPTRPHEIRSRFHMSYPKYMDELAAACRHPDAKKLAPAVVRRHATPRPSEKRSA